MRITLDQIKRLNFTSEILEDEVYKKQNGHYPVIWNRTIGKYLFEYIEEEGKVRVYNDDSFIHTLKQDNAVIYIVNRIAEIQAETDALSKESENLFK